MPNDNNRERYHMISLATICFITFAALATLKLCGIVTVSWAAIYIPLWIVFGLSIISIIVDIAFYIANSKLVNIITSTRRDS